MKQLIKKIGKGDRKAQGQFYDQYSPMVMGICLRYLKDYDSASDVFQEAFVKIFRGLENVKEIKALDGWIRKVTVHTALDHIRAIKYHEEISESGHELSDQFYSDLIDKMSMEVILDTINKLPEGYRVVFNMHVIDGYSHRDIANELKISEGTSRSQLSHAKRLLKRYLNELGITRYEQVI